MGVIITESEIWEIWLDVLENWSTNRGKKPLRDFIEMYLESERWSDVLTYNINEYLKDEISQYEQYRKKENSYQNHFNDLLYSGLFAGLHPGLKRVIKEFKHKKIEWLEVESKKGKTREGVKKDILIKFCKWFIMEELTENKILHYDYELEIVTKEIFISIIKKKLPAEKVALAKRYSRIF